ncbi:MAG: glycoside hydrolase family 3 protein [Spirochaetales bacterium]
MKNDAYATEDGKTALKRKIGQMLAIGFPSGAEGMASLRHVVEATFAGNVILFSRNTPDAEATRSTVAQLSSIIESATGFAPLVAIDQEGGIVARLRKGVTPLPGAMAQAAACMGGNAELGDIEKLGKVCGRELAALGILWNLAPVADVNINPKNPVIGVRSYGEDPYRVGEFASAFARGLRESGVVATAKHFPGHGDTSIDSHLDIPLVPHELERLEKVELLPFKRLIAENIPAIMTAHVRFPAVEPDLLPATLSARVLEGLLRRDMGFEGIICSDCMEMRAITDHFPNPYVMAVKAGVDILFISHTAERQIEAADSIYRAVLDGEIPESRIDASVSRILACKQSYRGNAGDSASEDGLEMGQEAFDLANRISRGSLTILRRGDARDFRKPDEGGLLIDLAPANITGAEDAADLPSIASRLDRRDTAWFSRKLPIDPSTGEIAEVMDYAHSTLEQGFSARLGDVGVAAGAAKIGAKPAIALSLIAPLLHKGQIELLIQCARLAGKMKTRLCVALMRSPYDAAGIAELCVREAGVEPMIIAAYEYTDLSAESMAGYLAGEFEARGVCPVTLPS